MILIGYFVVVVGFGVLAAVVRSVVGWVLLIKSTIHLFFERH